MNETLMSTRRRPLIAAVVTCVLVVTAGCGDARTQDESRESPSISGGVVSVVNTGMTLRSESPPQRIVSLYPSMTDLLIRLGVADRVVGQAGTSYSPSAPDTAATASTIPVLADAEVNRETLLATKPDLIVADQEYHFDRTGLPTREELARLGIPVYINQALWEPTKVSGTVEQSLNDVTDLGTLVRSSRAVGLRERLQRELDGQRARVRGQTPVRVVELTLFDRLVYAHAGGLYGDILTQAGATNLVAQKLMPAGDYQGQVSAEVIAATSPDVIVYSYRARSERADTERQLAELFGATPAGRRAAWVGVPESATSGGQASIDGIGELIDGFAPYRSSSSQ